MRLLRMLGVVGLVTIGVAASAGQAWAQAPGSKAEANQLFRDARNLLDQGRYKEACRLFERSLEVEPSPGTLLNLGNCHEQAGDLSRALDTFERAIADARLEPDAKKREAWVDAGTRRRDSLTGRVPIVNLRPSPTAGASVSLDGEVVSRVGEPLRLNPGRHQLAVSAPAKRDFQQELSLALGQVLTIALPELESAGPVAPPVEAAPPLRESDTGASSAGHGTKLGPWIAIGSGAALVTGGIITAVLAKSKENDLEQGCGAGPICQDRSLQRTRDSGENLALATYILWAIGGASAAAGVTWLALGHDESPNRSTQLSGACTDTGCAVFALGAF